MPALAVLALLLSASDPDLTDLDRRVAASLSATHEAGPVLVHYDPAALSAGWARREGDRALAALRLLESRLEVAWEGRAHLFLHRNEESFRASTGAPGEWGAFALGTRSIHLPRGAPVVHEMTHLVAHRFPGCEGRDPGGLWREGLASAMEGEDREIPVVSSSAVYARLGLLPPLASLRDHWPSGPPEGPHPYHVAGAFVSWVLESRGPAKLKEVYAAPERAEAILDHSWAELEGAWFAWLLECPVPEEEEAGTRRGLGLPADPLPRSLAEGRAADLLGEPAAARWRPARTGSWRAREEGGLVGTGGDRWSILETEEVFPPGTALRLRVRVEAGASLLLRLHRVTGDADEALLTPSGGLLAWRGGEGGFASTVVRLVPGRWTVVLLHSAGGTARLYLDGRLVREAEKAFREVEGGLGIGVRGGVVEVAEAAAVEPAPQER